MLIKMCFNFYLGAFQLLTATMLIKIDLHWKIFNQSLSTLENLSLSIFVDKVRLRKSDDALVTCFLSTGLIG